MGDVLGIAGGGLCLVEVRLSRRLRCCLNRRLSRRLERPLRPNVRLRLLNTRLWLNNRLSLRLRRTVVW
jgi:hypothetical protein